MERVANTQRIAIGGGGVRCGMKPHGTQGNKKETVALEIHGYANHGTSMNTE